MAKKVLPRSPADDALEKVREVCYAFPGTTEKVSHGAPSFFVRGKMFLMFADDHHGDDRCAVWIKSNKAEQQRLVAEGPERFFVPPYVGVNGWLGVRVDRPQTDWDELAVLVEEGWLAVAPNSAHGDPVRPPPKSEPIPRTDPEEAQAAFEKVEKICAALPESTCERTKRYATFRVRKKVYGYFFDNYSRDGKISMCFKAPPGKGAALVKKDPKRFYTPAYIGPRGWVAMRLDVGKIDWKDVAARITWSYESVAPKRKIKKT